MKRASQFLIILGAVIAGGAFFTFLTLSKTDSWETALLIGLIYSMLLVGSSVGVYKFTELRFSIFSNVQRWILKTIFFFLAISFAYLVGLIVQTILLTPTYVILNLITDTIWNTFISLISNPYAASGPDPLFTAEVRGIIFTVIAVLFLIGVISLIGSYVEVRWQDNRHHVLIDRAELSALRAQMEPHFLFNSLNTIASKTRENPQLAEELILQLSDILRYHYINAGESAVELASEIEFARKYANLLTTRFKNKLDIRFDIQVQNEKQKVPVFLIQPLIENAIRHAWKADHSLLRVLVEVKEMESGTQIQVSDNGIGIEKKILSKVFKMNHALANLSERLKLFYKRENLLHIISEDGTGTQVLILLPGKKDD